MLGGRTLGLDDLIFEYKVSLQHANRKKAECENLADKKIWGEITTSLEKGITYMQTGVSPWDFKSGEKANTQSRTIYADSYLLDYLNYKNPQTCAEKDLGEFETEMISSLLRKLTKQEKECYLLNKQCMCSYSDIAEYLNITIKSVENSIRRAKHKIDAQKEKSLLVNVYLNSENEVRK